jgi:hypothetical protein
MINPNRKTGSFFSVMGSGQAYLNMLYLLAAFPLGTLYFVCLISGFSLGISLVIVWVGIPILMLVWFVWWGFANFERLIAIYLLKEDIPALKIPSKHNTDLWSRFKDYITHPVTWKSVFYLFLKFPLGLATFVVLATFISLTLALLSMPFTYEFMQSSQAGIFLTPHWPLWTIDSIIDALLVGLLGLILWPITLHIVNGLALVHGKFARMMLSQDSIKKYFTFEPA